MEDIIFQTYGTFLLTLTGFVLPILAIAMTAFPEGIKVLTQSYINQQKQAEANLKLELEKQNEGSLVDVNLKLLTKNIKGLKRSKRQASKRLMYLEPRFFLVRSVVALGISLASFLMAMFLYKQPYYIGEVLISISIGFLLWAINIFYNSLGIVIEASTSVQVLHQTSQEKTLELLSIIADNSRKDDESLFIKQENVKVRFENKDLFKDSELAYEVNREYSIKIYLANTSEYMLKTSELGIIFPPECLIEGKDISSTYIGENEKIIRFKEQFIQSNTRQEYKIKVTFLKSGDFPMTVFVKGENLKNKKTTLKLKITG